MNERRVTRRGLIRGAAVAGAATLVRPTADVAAVLGGRAVFSRPIGLLFGRSAPIRAPRPFALVGVQWTGSGAAEIALRAQAPDGRWSPWVGASALGHDGDGQAGERARFAEPVWTGPAVAVELRSDRPVGGVRLHFVAVGVPADGDVAAALPRATPVLDAGPGQPPIIARRAWAGGQARPVHAPTYGAVKMAFVHHTVNPNGYGAAEVPAMLRAIFDYHVYVRGFWDIAYNFIVDAYGRIWEARAGGIDIPVIGAHAGAYNAESTGVAILGDFMNVTPSAAAGHALEHLLAWKLSLHGLPALGRAKVVVDPADAFYTPFRPGAHVSLPRIAGHRDGDLTDCPGNALYTELPAIRSRVSALAGTPARFRTSPASVLITAGASAELSGDLSLLSGPPLAGVPIELQRLPEAGGFASTFATLVTAGDGSFSQTVAFEHNTLVRALHRGFPASVGNWVTVAVAPAITLSVQSVSPLVLAGSVTPAKQHVRLDLYRAGRPMRKPVSTKRARAAAGTFRGRLRVPGPGDYVVVARTEAGAANAAGASEPLPVTIT